jgi:hypothetical protein
MSLRDASALLALRQSPPPTNHPRMMTTMVPKTDHHEYTNLRVELSCVYVVILTTRNGVHSFVILTTRNEVEGRKNLSCSRPDPRLPNSIIYPLFPSTSVLRKHNLKIFAISHARSSFVIASRVSCGVAISHARYPHSHCTITPHPPSQPHLRLVLRHPRQPVLVPA